MAEVVEKLRSWLLSLRLRIFLRTRSYECFNIETLFQNHNYRISDDKWHYQRLSKVWDWTCFWETDIFWMVWHFIAIPESLLSYLSSCLKPIKDQMESFAKKNFKKSLQTTWTYCICIGHCLHFFVAIMGWTKDQINFWIYWPGLYVP